MPDFKQRFRALVSTDRQPIRAEAPTVRGDDKVAVLRLYDPIDDWGGLWGVSAKEFVGVLDELPETTEEIRLLINSPGGVVFEGIAILNALRSRRARVVAVVEGLAASAASFIACGVDELVMAPNSELMVHSPWAGCIGDAEDMRAMATLLDGLESNIASIYQAKAGGELADWRAVMHAETWYSAEEAVAAGLADRVDGDQSDADQAKARFDLSIFNFAGRREAPEPQHPVSDSGGGPTTPPEGGPAVAFSDEQLTHLRQQLGVADDADEATILAALDETLERFVDPDTATPPAAALPEGVVAISEAQLAELRNDAQAGREARAEQIRAQRTALVDAAVSDGRIAPAEREAWLAKLDAGTGGEQVLAALKPGLVPVAPLGSGGNVDLESDDALYAELFGSEVKA